MNNTVYLVALQSELPPVEGLDIRYTGVGKVNAAHATMKAIANGAKRIVNFGTAGLVKPNKKHLVGQLLKVSYIVQRDMIAEPQAPRGTTPFETFGANKGSGLSPVILDHGKIDTKLYDNDDMPVTLGTGDSFVMEPDPWFNKAEVDVVDMEAYAIAKICALEGVEFECLKWISDFADEDAAETWEQNQSDGIHAMMAYIKKKDLKSLPNNTHFCTMPFMHAMISASGEVRPCCSWDFEVDKIESDPWPNINELGLHKAVKHRKFREVREALLNQEDVDGCRKCHRMEREQGRSFRTARLGADRQWINDTEFSPDFHELRYMETAFSILCNFSCRMCWGGVSTTYHRITEPGVPFPKGYSAPIESYDTDLANLREIKMVGGEPLMEKKHDEFLEKLMQKQDGSDLELIYHTNASTLPSDKVREFWSKCRKVTLNLSIDSYGYNNWEQRPGPYKWEDLVANCDKFKSWAKEWGNMELNIQATITKINVFHVHKMCEWVNRHWKDTPGWGCYDVQFAERPVELSITDWNDNEERIQEVHSYLDSKLQIPRHIKHHIRQALTDKKAQWYPGIMERQSKLDAYWKYDIEQYL
jgi:adenosylhomocysteine nucleosidase